MYRQVRLCAGYKVGNWTQRPYHCFPQVIEAKICAFLGVLAGRRCQATSKSGRLCGMRVRGKLFCHTHDKILRQPRAFPVVLGKYALLLRYRLKAIQYEPQRALAYAGRMRTWRALIRQVKRLVGDRIVCGEHAYRTGYGGQWYCLACRRAREGVLDIMEATGPDGPAAQTGRLSDLRHSLGKSGLLPIRTLRVIAMCLRNEDEGWLEQKLWRQEGRLWRVAPSR